MQLDKKNYGNFSVILIRMKWSQIFIHLHCLCENMSISAQFRRLL